MAVEFKAVTLDSGAYDHEGMLLFRDGRLLAVLSCLSAIHDEARGQWFVEATFDGSAPGMAPMFRSLSEAERWAAGQ